MMLRPTESKIIFIQQFGRGLRRADAEGKKFVNIIDFIGNHKTFLEKPAALFDFDLSSKEIGSFLKKYKDNSLDLPDESRVFYDPETIDFFKKYSLKMKKEEFIKFEDGDLTQNQSLKFTKDSTRQMFINYLNILVKLLTLMFIRCLVMSGQKVLKNNLFLLI